MSSESLYPLSFAADASTPGTAEYLQNPFLQRLVDYFDARGLAAIKQGDREETWYQDWIDYQGQHGLYASVLSPRAYSRRGQHFNILRLTRFLETFAYFSPAHAYSLHVSFLGLFPILTSDNEALKREAIARLEAGGLFAFGVSEKAHGSDLFANEFTVKHDGPEHWIADGTKYYIGNANAAGMISILGKRGDAATTDATKRAPFVFLVLRPNESPAYQDVRKIRTLGIRSAFVGEFAVKGHRLPDSDILTQGRSAWDSFHTTVNLGKFFLGFGSIGICEHAFAEALAHLSSRVLYGKPVLRMTHLQAAVVGSYARLVAMKLYAFRALDYLQIASDDDRRYLLFNAVQKAKVSTEAVKVLGLLSECIGARGFESETYFESALRDAQLIPGLEGSTHINFGLTAQFLDAYLAEPTGPVVSPRSLALGEAVADENPYWMQARDRNAKNVRFASPLAAYERWDAAANVRVFVEQLQTFRRFVADRSAALNRPGDVGLSIALGKCLATCVYGQLVAENCTAAQVSVPLVNCMFQGLVEDFSAEALRLSAMFEPGTAERDCLQPMFRVPCTSPDDIAWVAEWIAARYSVTWT